MSDPAAPPPDDAPTVADPSEQERVDYSYEVLERLSGREASFGRYRIKGEVASGGMGSILRVWDEDLRRHLAMKRILAEEDRGKGSGSGSKSLGRFLEEAQVTGQLDHPGIVPVHELGLDPEGHAYFTMKLVRGRTLREVFELAREEREGWTITRAVGVLLKVCEAMAYAHDKGVIHRDLKPANVMVGRFGEVYVMDWGLARVLDREESKDVRIQPDAESISKSMLQFDVRSSASGADSPLLTMDGDVVGTPAYMSPEQARGDQRAVDGRTDVYAVGAMLYHLLVGHMPFVPDGAVLNHYAVWSRLQESGPPPIHDLAPASPPELVAIAEKAMERDVDHRYASMVALSDDLRAWLEGRVVGAFEHGPVAELKKWVKRNRAIATTVAAALVIAFATIAGAAMRLAEKNRRLEEANATALAQTRIAEEQALEAERRGQALAEAQERFLRVAGLADRATLRDLRTEADELWPPHPERVAALEDWLARAESFAGKLEDHRSNLSELRSTRARREPREAAFTSGESALAAEATWVFDSAEDQWQHDHLTELIADVEVFAHPDEGTISDVRRRLQDASTLAERSVTGADAQWAWAEAIESIADEARCPQYGGLVLEPQIGLLPIGRDPLTGLWEFAHLLSGEPAQRSFEDGRVVLTEATGLVLVLIPGGTGWIGAQRTKPDGPNYDEQASDEENPVESVELSPFFLSKFEMTQGQWLHATGRNPSIYAPSDPSVASLLHPVENVNYRDCLRVTHQLGLMLPTEAQWEYAARAGTDTPWWTGREVESLRGAANIADSAFRNSGAPLDFPIEAWLDDGFQIHTVVGHYRANPFGLHDVHGNVWEWCRDAFDFYRNPMRPGDGLREPAEWKSYANRGGGWGGPASFARSARRYNNIPGAVSNDLGLRPAREVQAVPGTD